MAGLLLTVLVVGLVFSAAQAEGRVETVRWVQPDDRNVVGFHIYIGTSPRAYGDPIEVFPVPDTDGIYTYDITIEDDATLFVAVTAVNAQDLESEFSNECPLLAFPASSALYQFLGAVGDVIPSAANPTITPCPSLDAKTILSVMKNGPACVCRDTGSDVGAPYAALDCQAGACSVQLSCLSLLFDESRGDLTQVDQCNDPELVIR